MIYFDNAATSFFKPKAVVEAINFDISHSANSGRSGHKLAIEAGHKIELCRQYLLDKLGANDEFSLVFTKNCTEALNLAILGYIRQGAKVITTANEHNSVLRPLTELASNGAIKLEIIPQNQKGNIDLSSIDNALSGAELLIANAASNVTGALIDLTELGKIAKKHNVPLLVDGAQAVPIVPINVKEQNISMLAFPGHKSLHGLQGTGALIFKKSLRPEPLLYGGTGTSSFNLNHPRTIPEGYEAGTQFAGGISALYEGAKWSFDNVNKNRKQIKTLCDELNYFLKNISTKVYTNNSDVGIVSFNIGDIDSSLISEILDDKGFAVRSGLHCAPLVHKYLGTIKQGAVRVSLGVDNTQKEIYSFAENIEDIIKKGRLKL